MTTAIDAIGWLGVLLYVIAYYLVSVGRLSGRSKRYQHLNLVGATGVAVNAFYYGAFPSAIVNVIWFAIAAATLLGVLRGSEEVDPGQPASPEGRSMHRVLFFMGGLLAVLGMAMVVLALFPRPPQPLRPALVYTQDWPPYVRRSEPGGGPLSELVSEVFRGAGYDARIGFTDWEDALSNVQGGVAIAAFPYIRTERRAERVLFTDPLVDFDYVLFHRVDLTSPDGRAGDEAVRAWLDARSSGENEWAGEPWKLGTADDYALWPELAAIASADRTYPTPAEAFRALERGEIDLLAESRLVGLRTIADPRTDVDGSRIRVAGLEGDGRARSTASLRLVVQRSASGERLRDRLNERIAELRAQDRLAEARQQIEASDRVLVEIREVAEAVRSGAGDSRSARLAAGTRAVVLRWPDAFDPAKAPPRAADRGTDRTSMCRVKLLNGPMRGWEVLVAPEALAIVEQGGER